MLQLGLPALLLLWLPEQAWATCDQAGLCCAGRDVYFCNADGSANTGLAAYSSCDAAGCGYLTEYGFTGCAANGTELPATTSFCTGHCQAGCTGSNCPGACLPGTVCVQGACVNSACGMVADWRKSVWSGFAVPDGSVPFLAAPSTGVRTFCSSRYWSYGIKSDRSLVQWGFQHDTNNLFNNATVSSINDAVQVACSRWRLSVLHADGSLRAYGDSPYGQPAMPTNLSGIKAVAATTDSVGWVTSDGSITILPETYGFNQFNGNKPYQQVLADNKGGGTFRALSASGILDAGYIAIKTDGSVVVAARKYDYGPWPATPPAAVNDVAAAAVSLSFAIALKQDGSVVVWDSGNNVVPNPAGLKPCVAVAVWNTGIPVALQVDGTIRHWGGQHPTVATDPQFAALTAAADKLTSVTSLDPGGIGALYCLGNCGAVSDTGCCNGNSRYWCDATGTLQSENCPAGSCGWQTSAGHFCDTKCGQAGNGCYCDASCASIGDCCNAAGDGKAGGTCAGSTCGSCNGGLSAFQPNVYQCNSTGGPAPGGGQAPLQACMCIPNCAGKQCGADGCGGTCNKGSCDDGDDCTLQDACVGEACVGTPKACDDGNPCTADSCAMVSGAPTCQYVSAEGPCSDGNACTVGDTCAAGACQPGTSALTCNDGEVCTADACDAGSGCVYVPTTAPCSDNNACTVGDACQNGSCAPGSQPLACNDGNACTDDSCDKAKGCQYQPQTGTPCDDASSCTSNDVCSAGKCAGSGSLSCDDGNPCTKDDCLDATTCADKQPVQEGQSCSDGNACHLGGTCTAGVCGGFTALECNDGNPCTDDSCNAQTGCVYIHNNAPCSDNNACTSGDTCAGGACAAGAPLSLCDDGNPCTDDCNPASGCVKKPNTAMCDDGSVCTLTDQCAGGKCLGAQSKSCDDANVCTLDTCNAKLGCQHAAFGGACTDGNVCTQGDACWQGVCKAGGVVGCNDGNPCTLDTCDPTSGCVFVNTTLPCDDKSACTIGDVCLAGACTPGPTKPSCDDANPCTTDSCNPTLGCLHTNNYLPCDDGLACSESDVCVDGVCRGLAKQCADLNPCTDDACSASGVCTHTANAAACDDGDWTTVGDKCELGQCRPGKNQCDDNNICTTDSAGIEPIYATDTWLGQIVIGVKPTCAHTPTSAVACDDGDACTIGDACGNGVCVGNPVCVGGACQASSGKPSCTCPAGAKQSTNGDYTVCCLPNCSGKICGSDGCGGSCGDPCKSDEKCAADGTSCEPKVACWGKAPTDHACCDGRVVKRCGGLMSLAVVNCQATGQYCGWSAAKQDYACTNDGLTDPNPDPAKRVAFACPVVDSTCVPKCDGRQCGPDGCGGVCGSCASGSVCDPLAGSCLATACGGAVPATNCVKNLVWQKFASDTDADAFFAKNDPTAKGQDRLFLGCGCKNGTLDAAGVCNVAAYKGGTGEWVGRPVLNTSCILSYCNGGNSPEGVADFACPAANAGENEQLYRNGLAAWGAQGKLSCPNGEYFMPKDTRVLVSSYHAATKYPGKGLIWKGLLTKLQASGSVPKIIGCSEQKNATCSWPTKRVCGVDDGGKLCGTCPAGQSCNATGTACELTECGSKVCGTDASGKSCGSCPLGQSCTPDGTCTPCAAENADICMPSGDLSYCAKSTVVQLKCNEAKDPVSGAKAFKTCGPLPGLGGANTCFTPTVGRCSSTCTPLNGADAEAGSSTPKCSCDPSCEAAGTCCKGWELCGLDKLKATCGNKICESVGGEDGETCPADCPTTQVCASATLPAAPWPVQLQGAGTLTAKAVPLVQPGADVRPRQPDLPRAGLLAYAPELGVMVGAPRGVAAIHRTDETVATPTGTATIAANSTTIGSVPGVDGKGMLIDGQTETGTTSLVRRAALTTGADGMLRRNPSQLGATPGGFTVAAWVKVSEASTVLPNALGTSMDLGSGAWTDASVLNGVRPGLREACFASRPADPRLSVSCGADNIADVEAYWGDAGEDFLPDATKLDICYEWRKVRRSGICQDHDITARLRLACVGKTTCTPEPATIGADPCAGVAGTKSRLLVRALCGSAPAGANLWIEGQSAPAACKGNDCPPGPARRVVLQVPMAVPRAPAQYEADGNKGKIPKWGTLTLRSGSAVSAEKWFHVAVVFRPDQIPVDASKPGSASGVWSLYINGLPADQGYGRAPPVVGWQWGRGHLDNPQPSWPNVYGSKLIGAGPGDADTPVNAIANASFDDLFAFDRALAEPEIRALAEKNSVGALRVWPAVPARAVVAEQLWLSGGKAEVIPFELPWLRDPGACAKSASASGLVQAPFDALRVAAGATLAMPADGSDLDDLSTYTATAWLRAGALGAGKTLLEFRQGSAVRVRLETTAACGGRAIRALFADGKEVTQHNCDHVLAANQWAHVVVSQTETQRLLVLDGAPASVAAGGGPLFDPNAVGPRRVIATSAADLGFVGLYRAARSRGYAASLRSTGPVVWLSGASVKAGTPVDYANFHNESAAGPVDWPVLLTSQGQPAAGSWAEARVPLRGRLAPDAGVAIPPLSVTVSALPNPAKVSQGAGELLAQARNGDAGWQAKLRCLGTTSLTCDLFVVIRNGVGGEEYWQTGAVYKGPAAPAGGIPISFSVDGNILAAASFLEGTQGIAPLSQISAAEAGSMAFTAAGKAGEASLSFYQGAGFGLTHLRAWYGAGAEDNLAAMQMTSCADKSLATTCASQNRVCANVTGTGPGAPTVGMCAGCAPGFGDALGSCLAKKAALQSCSIDAECEGGPCVNNICLWDAAHKSDCAAVCGAIGHACGPLGSAFACANTCIDDYTLVPTAKVDAIHPGYQGLQLCQWTPTLDFGMACSRNTQCKGTGVCVPNQEDVVSISPATAGKVGMKEGSYTTTVEVKDYDEYQVPKWTYVHIGPNWTCASSSASDACAEWTAKTGPVGRCLQPNAAQCTKLNRTALSAAGKDAAGQDRKGVVCGECLKTLNKETNQPVYEKRRRYLEPKACATILNNYSRLADWNSIFPANGGGACANSVLSAPYYASNYAWGTLQRKGSGTIKALMPNGTSSTPPADIHSGALGNFVGFGHTVGQVVYLQFREPSTSLVPDGCTASVGVRERRGDILSYTPDLPRLGHLLGVKVPDTTAALTKDQIDALRAAGVGSAAMAAIAYNEGKAYADWQHFNLQDCMAASYDVYVPHYNYGSNAYTSAGWVTKDTVNATMFDPNENGTRCSYKQQPLGTTCPFDPAQDNVANANAMCESYYCGYDTGKCAEAVKEVESVKGSSTDSSSGQLNDEFGAFRFTHMSEAAIRFGKYPKQTIFQALNLPMGLESELADVPGQVKDRRHLQARAMLKADVFFPVPKSLQSTVGKSELDWTLCDFDLGYTIVPAHKRPQKRIRYAPKIALLGLTLVEQTPRPSTGEPCQSGAPKTCGFDASDAQAALTCQNGVWTYVAGDLKCGADTTCTEGTLGGLSCAPNLAISLSCSNQVRDGNYVPPGSPQNKCKLEKSKPTVANGSDVGVMVPNDTGIDILDIKFPTLGGVCTAEKQAEMSVKTGSPKPVWTQGLGSKKASAEDIVDAAAGLATTGCLKKGGKESDKAKGAKVIEECMQELLDKYSGAPGTPPTKACFRASPVWIGPLPLTFEAEAAPVLRFKAGIKVDDTTFEPAVFLRPSLGLEIHAVAKFDLAEVVGIKPLMQAIESKSKALAKILKWAASKISAEAGIEGELAIVEVAFPITWSLSMIQQTREVDPTVQYSLDGKSTVQLNKGDIIPDLWQLVAKFQVDLELTLLRLQLKLFYKFGIKGLPFNPQIEKEMPLFTFAGFVFNWKLAGSELRRWRTDFGWAGPKFPE